VARRSTGLGKEDNFRVHHRPVVMDFRSLIID
jgi:hypothetical protein